MLSLHSLGVKIPFAIACGLVVCLMLGQSGCRTSPNESGSEFVAEPEERVEQMSKRVDGHRLSYLLQTPGGNEPPSGWPLLLFLHGYGECGDEIEKVKKHGPPKILADVTLLKECVIVSPQCPNDSWWRVDALHALVEEVVAKQGNIDRSRLYVTGLSMGGYGIWSFLSNYPDYFAAAVPICGGGDPFRLPANRPPEKQGIVNEFLPAGLSLATKVPVWAFHGSDDRSVPIKESEMMLTLLTQGGNTEARLTEYPGVGHVGAWERAYDDLALWQWLFSQ